jgi:tRNA (uracil-5-)-methyltransferase
MACKYFGTCGGCLLQHISYEAQLTQKAEKLKHITSKDVQIVSGPEFGYRNRMDFIFTSAGLGLRKRGDWRTIIDIEQCPIANKRINEVLNEIRAFFKDVDVFDVRRNTGTFRYAVIRTADSGVSVSFVLNKDSTKISDATDLIEKFAKETNVENIVVTYVHSKTDVSVGEEFYVVKGNDFLEQNYIGKKFRYAIQGFFQNNHIVAEKLQNYIHEKIKSYDTKHVELLDLYGGVGTFGICNADLFQKVTSVESFAGCTDAAKENIKINSLDNVQAITLDAKNLKKLEFGKLFVITDPPRSGMHEKTIQQLQALEPEVIIYISCNIDQLGKDLIKFKQYEVKEATLFDMFPQTPHCEGVVVLERLKEINNL